MSGPTPPPPTTGNALLVRCSHVGIGTLELPEGPSPAVFFHTEGVGTLAVPIPRNMLAYLAGDLLVAAGHNSIGKSVRLLAVCPGDDP